MVELADRIDVRAPIGAVYALWNRFEEFPAFMGGVESVTRQPDGRLHWAVAIAGIERAFDAEITEQQPDERIAWRSVDGEQHSGVVTFHRVDDETTRVLLQMHWKPQGFIEEIGAVLQLDDLQIGHDLRRFKEIAERATELREPEPGD